MGVGPERRDVHGGASSCDKIDGTCFARERTGMEGKKGDLYAATEEPRMAENRLGVRTRSSFKSARNNPYHVLNRGV